MALYIEQRIDQLEVHAINDGKLLETVADGLANLTVQVQKNHELQQRNYNELRAEMHEQIGGLRTEMNQRFEKVEGNISDLRQDMRDVKTTLSLMMKLLEERLR